MKFALALSSLSFLVACGSNRGADPAPTVGADAVAAQDDSRPLAVRLADAEKQLATFCQVGGTPATCAVEPDLKFRLEAHREAIANYRRLAQESGVLEDRVRARSVRVNAAAQAALPRLEKEIERAQVRSAKQEELVKQINAQVGCGIVVFEPGQRMTFGRELGLASECSALEARDYARAAKLLRGLADVSLGGEAIGFREKAQAFENLGPDVAYLMNLRRQLLELNVVQFDRGLVRVNHIGHPYGSVDDTYLLRSYSFGVKRLARRHAAPNVVFEACPQPVCDPQIYKVAEAVTLKPEIDRAFLTDGDRVVAPSAHALIAFNELISANSAIRASMGLEPMDYGPQAFESRLVEDDSVLVFPSVFGPDNPTLSIDKYPDKTPYPYVYKFFAMFQEARYVVNSIQRLQNQRNEVATAIKDVRFEAADDSGRLLVLTKIPGGGYRLSLKVLDPANPMSIEATRQAVLGALPQFFASARENN